MAAIQTNQIFEDIVETIREPLLVLNPDLKIISANRSFYNSFKVKPEETMGQLIYDLGNKQWDIPKLRELLETILPQKTSFDNYEVEHDFATIGRRTMLLNARQIERGVGEERIILLAIEDITERRQIEDGLEETRKELEAIKKTADEAHEFADSVINTVREPLIALDQDLRVFSVSRSFYDFFKVKPEETMGQLIYDLGNKQWDIPKLRELLETILPQKTSFDNYEVEHDFATIGRRTMLLNARQIERGVGEERIILLAIEDITERKRLEDILAESEDRYRRVFETASDGILLLEKREGKIAYANQAIGKMLGYSLEEIIGKKLQDVGIVDIDDFPTILENLNEVGITNFINVSIKANSGQDIDTDIYLADRATLVQCNIRDITERVQAHAEQKKIEAQLQHAQKMEAIGTLAGGIAHDFNNILSAIIGYSEVALMDIPEGSKVSHDIQEVLIAGNRAKDLVKQILTFAREGDDEVKPIHVKYILKEALKMLKSSVPSSIEIRETIESDVMILADPTQIYQVIMNLCTNAVQAMKDEVGVMKVQLKEVSLDSRFTERHPKILPGNYLQLRVEDTGYGMNPDVLKKIFDPYFTTKGVGEGTGLGLSVTKGIIDGCRGAITIKSEIGKGSIFDVYFPILEPTSRELAPKSEKEEAPTGDEAVLVIDDDHSITRLIQHLLKALGYRATGQTSSIEALELFKSDPGRFDLVITDMTMPQMTGDLLAMEIKKIRSDIPVILCTGYSRRMSEEVARTIGIDAFLMKPVVKLEMAKTVRKVLDEK